MTTHEATHGALHAAAFGFSGGNLAIVVAVVGGENFLRFAHHFGERNGAIRIGIEFVLVGSDPRLACRSFVILIAPASAPLSRRLFLIFSAALASSPTAATTTIPTECFGGGVPSGLNVLNSHRAIVVHLVVDLMGVTIQLIVEEVVIPV